jgi:hypothetical protein
MKIEVNLEKRYFFTLLGTILILGGILGVIAYNSGAEPSVFGHSAEELDVEINGQTMTLQEAIDGSLFSKNDPYVVIAPKASRGTTVNIPESVIIDYCGDQDGCALREVMYNWDGDERSASVMNTFYYNPINKNWRGSHHRGDREAENGNGASEHIDIIWGNCHFTDGKYDNWVNLGDNNLDFGLLSWNAYDAECRLFIYD